jgi:CRISPR/Cas system CSM-associated protein Csm3 (group 7 of RAMP superfamily)
MRKNYTITFTSDWHTGSGLGDSHAADAVLARDADGLPFLGGRAVKGALREGARRLGLCRDDLSRCERIFFGSNSAESVSNTPGRIRVSAAGLPEHIRRLVCEQGGQERLGLVRHMTVHRRQTALENGMVKDGTLRTLECGIPHMAFSGHLDVDLQGLDISEAWATAWLHAVCAAVKSMGGHRSRGLGRCRARLEDQPDPVELPPTSSL